MKLKRTTWLAFGAACVAAIVLGIVARWHSLEAERAQAAEKTLRATQAELESSRATLEKARQQLDESVAVAEREADTLNAAVKNSKQYQETQRQQSTRATGLVNALTAAAGIKTAMTEYYMTEGKWPASNKELGMPEPTGFKAAGVRSVGIVPGGAIQMIVDDLGKRAELYLRADANAAGQIHWRCESRAIPDIAQIVPACTYKR